MTQANINVDGVSFSLVLRSGRSANNTVIANAHAIGVFVCCFVLFDFDAIVQLLAYLESMLHLRRRPATGAIRSVV